MPSKPSWGSVEAPLALRSPRASKREKYLKSYGVPMEYLWNNTVSPPSLIQCTTPGPREPLQTFRMFQRAPRAVRTLHSGCLGQRGEGLPSRSQAAKTFCTGGTDGGRLDRCLNTMRFPKFAKANDLPPRPAWPPLAAGSFFSAPCLPEVR